MQQTPPGEVINSDAIDPRARIVARVMVQNIMLSFEESDEQLLQINGQSIGKIEERQRIVWETLFRNPGNLITIGAFIDAGWQDPDKPLTKARRPRNAPILLQQDLVKIQGQLSGIIEVTAGVRLNPLRFVRAHGGYEGYILEAEKVEDGQEQEEKLREIKGLIENMLEGEELASLDEQQLSLLYCLASTINQPKQAITVEQVWGDAIKLFKIKTDYGRAVSLMRKWATSPSSFKSFYVMMSHERSPGQASKQPHFWIEQKVE